MARAVATSSARRINVVPSSTEGKEENSAGERMYRLAGRITRPAAMFKANRNEMAIGGNGTTSMINTSRTTMGPESWVALNTLGRGRTVSLAMNQRRNRGDQLRRVILKAAHHQRAGEGDDQSDTRQFQNERDRGLANLRHGLQNPNHKANNNKRKKKQKETRR